MLISGNPTPKKKGYGPGEQDWGWIKVRTGAHMFYWLYYTTAKVSSFYERPLVIWLQGGPGASSTGYGNFKEVGPLYTNGTIREYGWVGRQSLRIWEARRFPSNIENFQISGETS